LVDEIKYFTRGVAFACFSKLLTAAELLEQITSQGLDFIPELVRILDNVAIRAEHENYLGVEPCRHLVERQGHANGSIPKTVYARMDEVTFAVPHVRDGGFYP
jgi:putative transposase